MVYLIFFICLTIVSQVMLKKESVKREALRNKSYLSQMLTNPIVLVAYLISLMNVFIWMFSLTKIPLIVAVLFTSSINVLMLLMDNWVFKQQITRNKVIGAVLIMTGIIFSLWKD